MFDNKIAFCIILGLILAFINLFLVYMYDFYNSSYEYLINSFFEDNYYEDLRSFYRVKYIYGDSINNLQLIIFVYDCIYTSIFFLITNRKFLNKFSLNFNSIPTQNKANLSNFFLEFFFACMIKLIPLIINIVISFISLDTLKITLKNSLENREVLSKLNYSFLILIIYMIVNMSITLLFLGLYLLKFLSFKNLEPMKSEDEKMVKEISSTEGDIGLSSNSFLSLTRSSKQEQLINE